MNGIPSVEKKTRGFQVAQRWRSLVEQSPDGIVVHDVGGKISFANPAAIRLFGLKSLAELEGHSLLDFLDERSCTLAKTQWEKLGRGEPVQTLEMRVLRDPDDRVEVEVYTCHLPETGEIQAFFHDVTRAKTIVGEMHHRVRRSFNQVKGLLAFQEQFVRNTPEVLHAFSTLRERIQAMELVHSILYRTGEASQVNMQLYLHELREALIREHGDGGDIAVDFSVAKVLLNEKQATSCGLIVTELVWNSLLHAFPPDALQGRKGRVSVSLHSHAGNLRLVVADNGIGMPRTHKQPCQTTGLSMVRGLVSTELKGTIKKTSANPGTCFTISFRRNLNRKDVSNGK